MPEIAPVSRGELIHAQVWGAIETAVHGELAAAGEQAWTSALLPRDQRRGREVNEAMVGICLADGNTRRIRSAVQPLLKAAPLSKSAVSRLVATLKDGPAAWMARSLAELNIVYLTLDALALRVRRAGKVVSVPVLTAVAVLADGQKQLLGLELLTFFRFPTTQGKTLRTTNVIERLNEEFRRRVKTHGFLPTEDAALLLLFGLVANGQITRRKIDGYTKIASVISTRTQSAA